MTSAQGYQLQGAFDLVDVDVNSVPIEIVRETLTANYELVESDGIRGTRSHTKERVRRGLIRVGGSIVMHPSPTELDALLPVIVGGTETTDVFPLAETLPEFDFMLDKGTKVYDFADCKVASAVFRGSPGTPLEVELEIVGKTATEGNAGTFPALTFDTDTMYVFTDSVFTYDTSSIGAAYPIMMFELRIDNFAQARFTNSTTATDISARDRRVTLSIESPWTSTESALLVTSSVAGSDGSLVLTNGGQSLSFAFANMKLNPASIPVVNGREETVLRSNYNIYKSGSTNELIITHDSAA